MLLYISKYNHIKSIKKFYISNCRLFLVDNKKEIKKSTWVPITNGYHNGQNYGGHAQPNHAKRHKRSSSSYDNGNTLHNPCQDHHMHNYKEHPVCNVPICINAFHVGEHGIANSFENVMSAMAWFKLLGQKEAGEKLLKQTVVIAVGLGKCDQLYKGKSVMAMVSCLWIFHFFNQNFQYHTAILYFSKQEICLPKILISMILVLIRSQMIMETKKT